MRVSIRGTLRQELCVGGLYKVGGLLDALMLPDPKGGPAQGAQTTISVLVPLLILSNLCIPVGPVCPSFGAVDWTTVPKAAIHEDSKTDASEHDVCLSAEPWEHLNMSPVPHATTV